MKIGEQLRKFRLDNKLSQHDIADHLGISQSAYNNYENNRSNFKAEFLPKIAEFYGVDVTEFIPEGTVVRVMNNTNQQNHDQTIVGFDIKMDARSLYNDFMKTKDDLIKSQNDLLKAKDDTIEAHRNTISVRDNQIVDLQTEIARLRSI